ncbi:EF hand domain-containing protein [Cordyceps javanica]|uniref:EF hand domain-containing protein n=1 Tax=Cordyceps javanica TaxID=43265 RepID=A0A545V8J3_9HYPO|nr:EF hand domain-containing protein [Cordyceps javanica]TQW08777.1 EF hand domain-containing protein [Cordyceps javanica]
MLARTLIAAAFVTVASAHGSHGGGAHGDGAHGGGAHGGAYGEEARTDYPNWMTRHMAEEHGMDTFDALSFFTLHDFDSDGVWEREEMQRMYGLMDPSNRDVTDDRREEAYRELLKQLDANNDGFVSRDEFATFIIDGKTLPDLGFGPGHHGDDEYEYEVHHWNKYHNEDTTLEDLTHPEDIEHFKKHEEMEDAEEKQKAMDKISIIEANIPAKFLRVQQ